MDNQKQPPRQRSKPISLAPLSTEDALRGAMAVKPPTETAETGDEESRQPEADGDSQDQE